MLLAQICSIMNDKELAGMDAKADELIKSWIVGSDLSNPENIKVKKCTMKMSNGFTGVYGTVIDPSLLGDYANIAGQWVLNEGSGMAFGIAVEKIYGALKQAYHDKASGKQAPTPKEFKEYVLKVDPGHFHIKGSDVKLIHTKADGSVESR